MRRKNINRLRAQFGAVAHGKTNEQIAFALEREGLIEVRGESYFETRKMRDIPRGEFMRVVGLLLEGLSKKKWVEFAEETYRGDENKGPVPNFQDFGDLMEKVFLREGSIESVLWDTANPHGTEDRTWVRTYLAIKGHPAYADMFEGLDGAHAKRIRERFRGAK